VSVTIDVNGDTQATDSLAGAFTYRPGGTTGQPGIFSVTPNAGPNEGGTRVVIVGEGFEAPVQVLFGRSDTVFVEAQVDSVSPTRIEATSPAATGFGSLNQNEIVNVRVRNLSSGLQAELAGAFRYGFGGDLIFISGIDPDEGSITGRDEDGDPILVTIFGQGFVAPVRVYIGNPTNPDSVPQDVISVSGTEIVFRLRPITERGCVEFSDQVYVTNLNTNEQAVGPAFTYTISLPVILGLTPNNGSAGGNTLVTISGLNFDDPVRVLFGPNAGNVISTTATSIGVRTPPFTGTFDTQSCTTGDDMAGTQQVAASVNVTVINLETGCSDTLPGGFTYNPSIPGCVATGGGGG
jgi:hypothetical protein